MFRGRYNSYALMLVVATVVIPLRMVGRISRWQTQRFDKIKKLLADSGRNKGKIDKSTPITQVDVLVELWGQLGNHLHMLGKANTIKFFAAKSNPPVEVKMHYSALAPGLSHLQSTRKDISACFTNFEDANFYEIDESTKNEMVQNQTQYKFRNLIKVHANAPVDKQLQSKLNFIVNKEFLKFDGSAGIPYLRVRSFTDAFIIDQYYDDFLKLFNFDEEKCCNEVPEPDETVVHIRSFGPISDKRKDFKTLKVGRKELGPNQMANELLGHLKEGDKVALVAHTTAISTPFKLVLEKKGIKVRLLSQNRVQDFCFLMKATKELVGHHQSTFVFWAGILNTSVKKVTLYHVTSPEYTLNSWPTQTHNFTHPKLKNRFEYPGIEYKPELEN